MIVADLVAEWLEVRGISQAFGIIGGGNARLWDAIHRRGATSLVCCHHEQAAAQAATYYQRVCGKVALTLVTSGAGSTNAITGVMAAWADSVPLLVISGNESSKYFDAPGRCFGFQGYRAADLARHFTKLAVTMIPGACTHERLTSYLDVATEGRGGPVWLDFPKDVQNAMA